MVVSETVQISYTDDSTTLKLLNCTPADSGKTFSVKVINDFGETISNRSNLTVSSGPIIENELEDQKVLRDKEAKFECIITGIPKPQVQWLFNDKELTTREGIKYEKDINNNRYAFIIPKVNSSGVIKLKATNEYGTVEKTCNLELLDLPKALNKLENITVSESESAKLSIKVSGNPKPSVKWYKNDIELIITDLYEICESDDEVTLLIKSCTHDDSGSYFAKISNSFGEVSSNKATLNIQKTPKFVSHPNDTAISIDGPLRLDCVVQGNPRPKLTWTVNGRELAAKDGCRFEYDQKTSTDSLVIAKVTNTHAGTYVVKATNNIGESECTFNVDVVEPPKVSGKFENVTANEGESGNLTINFTGKPKPTIKWFKNEVEIQIDGEKYQLVDKENSYQLVINKVDKDVDSGSYSATLTNQAGQVTSSKAQLTVNTLPKFTKELEDTNIEFNSPFEWKFSFSGQPEPKLSIFKNGKEVAIGRDTQFKLARSVETVDNIKVYNCTLKFEKAKPEDIGLYKVELTNSAGVKASEANLNVAGAPEITSKPENAVISIGKTIKFECTVSGYPIPEVTWYKGDELLSDNDRYKMETKQKNTFLFSLRSAIKEDAGEYKVKVSNSSGQAEEKFMLNVQGSPEFTKPLNQASESLEKSQCILEVSATGNPAPNITWIKNKITLNETSNERYKFENIDENTFRLVINDCEIEDSGYYVAKAKNTIGESSTSTQLTVVTVPKITKRLNLYNSPSVNEQDPRVVVNVKQPLKLECAITGVPKPNVFWTRDDMRLNSSDKIKLDNKVDTYVLTIKEATVHDEGKYSVIAENSYGSVTTDLIVTVNSPPVFIENLKNVEVNVDKNENCELAVVYDGKPKPEVTWQFGDRTLERSSSDYSISEEINEETNQNRSVLRLKTNKADLAGTYKCKLKNQVSELVSSANLSVLKAPKFINELPQTVEVLEKKEIKLDVSVNDDCSPKPTIVWTKDGNTLSASKKIIISKPQPDASTNSVIYSLVINDASVSDCGSYSVKVSNNVDNIESSSTIEVLCPPKITKDLKQTIECTNGEPFALEVTAQGKPKPDYVWYHNDSEVNSADINSGMRDNNVFYLKFDKILMENSGTYNLKLSNKAGIAESKCNVVVNCSPVIKNQLTDVTTSEGSECLLSLTAIGFPNVTAEWFKNGTKVKGDKRYSIKTEEEGTKFCLYINDARSDDQGKYKAVLKNKVGTIESDEVNLVVSAGPKITKMLKDSEVTEGSTVDLVCEVLGKPAPSYTWSRNGQLIESNDRYETVVKDNTFTLKIKNITENESGLYVASFKNDLGVSDTKCNMTVLTQPKFIRSLEGEIKTRLTETLELEIEVSGEPLPKIKYSKDGRDLANVYDFKDRLKFESKEVNKHLIVKAIIENIQAGDAGLYKVEAFNKCGQSSCESQISVSGAPSFVRQPIDTFVVEKKPLKIECEVRGVPLPIVEWFKGDQLITASDKIKLETRNNNTFILSVPVTTADFDGAYKIRLSNEHGESTHEFNVIVEIAPFLATPLNEKYQVRENESLIIDFDLKGNPEPKITWIKKGEDIVPDDENGYDIAKNKLIIKSANPSHAGVYNLVANNKVGKFNAKIEIIVLIAPKFIRRIIDTQVIEKRVTKLEAEILAVPKANVKWLKNGAPIAFNDRVQAVEAKCGVYQLVIKNSQNDDMGVYVLTASNDVGEAESKAEIVIEKKPEFVKKLETLEAVFSCEAEWLFQLIGVPKPEITFSRNNIDIDLASSSDVYELKDLDNNNYCLLFKNVSNEDAGSWACQAVNSAGRASCLSKLEVLALEGPKFIKELKDIMLPEEKDNKLDVVVTGRPFPQIEWFKNNELINIAADSSKYRLEKDMNRGTLSLVIRNCENETDSGSYKARIFNKGGEAESVCEVKIYGYAPRFVEKPEKLYTLVNQTVAFGAIIDAKPPATVTWSKARNELSNSDEINIYSDESINAYFMDIVSCKSKDAGTYQITATNEHGTETCSVTLILTQNEGEVVDHKALLLKRKGSARKDDSNDPDWGKLKKAGQGRKDGPDDMEMIKLRKVSKDKVETSEDKDRTAIPEHDPYKGKEFGPRDKIELDSLERKRDKKEGEEDDESKEGKNKAKSDKPDSENANKFTRTLIDAIVPEHKLSIFECAVSDATASVQWYINGTPIESFTKKNKYIKLAINDLRRLSIRNCLISETDSQVTCKWDNLETSAKLFVNEALFEFVGQLKNASVKPKSDAVFECEIKNKSTEGLVFKWRKNGKDIDLEGSSKYEYVIDGDKHRLIIKDCDNDDQGDYEIYLVEPQDFDFSSKAQLNVEEELPAEILSPLKNVTCVEGEEIEFSCELSKEVPLESVKWFKDGIELQSDDRTIIKSDGLKYSLIVKGSKIRDSGNYEVKVDRKRSNASCKVKPEPISFVRQLENSYNGVEGGVVKLECELSKAVPCVWKLYGKVIESNDKFEVEQDGPVQRLIIKDLSLFDKGSITCSYLDKKGDELASTDTKLTIGEAPVAIIKHLEDVEVPEENDAILSVELNKSGQEVQWFKDGQKLSSSSKVRLSSRDCVYQIKITSCEARNDEGSYSFKVNDLDSNCKLKVLCKPLEIKVPLRDRVCVEKQTVRFEIVLNKTDQLDQLDWFKDGKPIDLESGHYEVKGSGEKYILVIKDVKFEDDGEYTVKIKGTNQESSAKLLVQETPLEFITPLKNVNCTEDDRIVLECELNKPDDKIQWYRDGEPIDPAQDDNIVIEKDGNKHRLIIKSARPSDGAKYSIKTSGPFSACRVNVDEIPIEFIKKLQDVTVKEKEVAIFECQLQKHFPELKWVVNDIEIENNDKFRMTNDSGKVKLEILDCQLSDINDYAISIRGRKWNAHLDVQELPIEILGKLKDVTVYEKEDIVLDCECSKSNVQSQWHSNGMDIKFSIGLDRIEKSVVNSVHKVIIHEAALEDSGLFSCTFKGGVKTTCNVKVVERPVEVIEPLQDTVCTENQTIVLQCVLSKPRLKVEWFKDDAPLKENKHIQILSEGKTYKIVLNQTELDDIGRYKIKFKDEAETSCQLSVNLAPIKVKSDLNDVEATEGDELATFQAEFSREITSEHKLVVIYNHKDVTKDEKYRLEVKGKTLLLKVQNIALEDEGKYIVQVDNNKTSANLIVNEKPVIFTKQLKNVSGFDGDEAVFECEISKHKWFKTNTEVFLKWYKGERELRDGIKYSIIRDKCKQKLIVKDLAITDEQEYSAVVGKERTSGRLEVQDGPVRFIKPLKDSLVNEYETIKLECEVNKTTNSRTGEQIPVKWFKNDVEIKPSGKFDISIIGNKLVLKIDSVTPEELGVYTVSIGDSKSSCKLEVIEIPARIKRPLADVKQKEGLTAYFEIIISRSDKDATWFVNRKEITSELVRSGKYNVQKDKSRFELAINNLTMDETDSRVVVQIGDVKSEAKLIVEEELIKIINKVNDVGVKENNEAEFSCTVSKLNYLDSKLIPKFKWYLNNKEISSRNSNYTLSQEGTTFKLKIKSASEGGEIKFVVHDDVYSAASLIVDEAPVVFVKPLEDKICKSLPETVTFETELNKPNVNVVWLKDGEEIDSDLHNEISQNGCKHYLRVKCTDGSFEGVYTIRVKSSPDHKSSANLLIQTAPKIFLDAFYKDTITIKRGTPLLIEVAFSAHPLPDASWLINDEPLKTTDSRMKSEIFKNRQVNFNLTNTQRSDSGTYTLTLQNAFGKENCNIKVIVLDRPGPPVNLDVTGITGNFIKKNFDA